MAAHRKSFRITRQGLIFCAAVAAVQLLCYFLPRLFLPQLTMHVLTGPLDERIPFSPPWVVVYFLSFPFWGVSALWIFSQERTHACRTAAAYMLALLLSAAVFLIWPGTMERPEITGSGFFCDWMRLLYRLDSPTNLCPSLHVLATYFCWRGAMSCRIPRWYRVFSFVFLLLVCCSVVLVKQHALVDIPAGIFTAELSLQAARLFRLERLVFPLSPSPQKERIES